MEIVAPMPRADLRLSWKTAETQLGLFGPSGAGKTTILEVIAGLRRNVRGVIRVGDATWLDTDRGVNLPPEKRGVGYVPQDGLLFPHLDVMENVMTGARRARTRGRSALDPGRVLEVLELSVLRRRPVTALSGGERQRVALGRALCSAPDLLLLDEPLASLDRVLRRRILPYLLRVQEDFGLPTIHVSHETTEMLALAREVIVLADGKPAARGDPRDVLIDSVAAGAEAVENVMRGRVLRVDRSVAELSLAPGIDIVVARQELEPDVEAIVALRAEDVIVATTPSAGLSAQNDLPAEIVALHDPSVDEGQEGAVLVSCTLPGSTIRLAAIVTSRAVSRLALRQGMNVRLLFKAQAVRVLGSIERTSSRSRDVETGDQAASHGN